MLRFLQVYFIGMSIGKIGLGLLGQVDAAIPIIPTNNDETPLGHDGYDPRQKVARVKTVGTKGKAVLSLDPIHGIFYELHHMERLSPVPHRPPQSDQIVLV